MNNNIFDYPFIRYPRVLIESPVFSHISIEARTLFAMILDRFCLSAINADKFTDEQGEIYVICTLEEICRKFGCGNTKAIRIFRELETQDLIIRKRKSHNSPFKIYITDRFLELTKQEFTNSQNDNSPVHEIRLHEFSKRKYSKNNNSNNNISNTHSSIIGFERTEDEIKEQIEYDCIVCDDNKNLLDEIVMIIFDVLNGTSPTVRVGRNDMPRGAVISRFCKLNSEHIYYVFSKLESSVNKIINIKPYLITMLYNAPATIESDATAEYAFRQKIS